ncbi:unnamed protein product [Peniophora sp. CBMAI 1063]|nr:unnamed protein product [Peniophora sp. CBMAI 1063]
MATPSLFSKILLLSCASSIVLASHIHPARHGLYSRASEVIPTDLPGNWTSIGCYTDNPGARTLTGPSFVNTTGMTIESCVRFCDAQSAIYAGTEFAQECYCGDTFSNGGTNASLTDCNTPCTGNASETCGAGGRLSVYWSGEQPPPAPVTAPSVGLWVSLGCYNDSTASRSLSVVPAITGGSSNNSIQSCTAACFALGYHLAGAEFADECYCDTELRNGATSTPLTDCSMTCSGNSSEFCGGPSRLNVYNYTGANLPPIKPVGGGGDGGGASTPLFPVTTGLPTGWAYNACWVDNAHGRILPTEFPDNATLTVEGCVESCVSQNYTVAGMEFSTQCFCGQELINGAVVGTESSCSNACGGNSTEACGGPDRMSIYTSSKNLTALPVPVTQNTSLPGQFKYVGCLAEPGAQRVFPYQIINTNNNSATACLTQCAAFGYPAAGMEFGDECWCGDVADIAQNGGTMAPETDCNAPCSGDPIHLCGGSQRLSLYEWDGDLYVWHEPENIGRYEYFIPGLIPPLTATLGKNGKVSFLEKFGTSEFSNSTGAYELDISLAPDFNTAWREMHVKSDVFCNGALVLPDKDARILSIGGWSVDSLYGVRLYIPDGEPGVNGTNDWEEDSSVLRLQDPRWYPSAMMMSNGSILIVGGENGSNGPPVPTLEILPTIPGSGTKFLDYLNRTDPNNLYPFLHVMPSGRIFIGYYNEARLLDPHTLDTAVVLPNMPGSVTSFLAGRTYPMEGTTVMLPQYPPYTDPVTLLVCGGSNFGIALDNCVSIQPEAANPQWVIERMPSKRVMPAIVTLPDGTFMILNGAQQGVAGFGLASDPNFSALLYDPTQPVNQRISILNTTTIARLYHNEAILLPDGRVLVSGSDPNPDPPFIFPEELRVEVYIPPYLNQGRTQPTYNITDTDWAYGTQHQIHNVTLFEATSSTHGNAMGNRIIFPAYSCSGSTCTITAPPNAFVSPPSWWQLFVLDGPTPSHGQFVRIGGDPAQLGNWPDFPGFTLPGV